MRLSLSFAGLLALVTAAACASNEPSPPPAPGSIAPDTAVTPTATTPADTAAPPTATAAPTTPPTATASGTAPQAKTCQYNGMTHPVGASFPATDGCNTCNCRESGVACTEMACKAAPTGCSPDKEPNRDYKMRNPETCKTALFRCPEGKKAFFNTCGCGCE